mmetsp:Transcript_17220/g.54793  ORF Transcript_17220/g.54793 Transcript_17220/m.54793 type:complete len:336 (+) Transcript_17220:230-1237(+)
MNKEQDGAVARALRVREGFEARPSFLGLVVTLTERHAINLDSLGHALDGKVDVAGLFERAGGRKQRHRKCGVHVTSRRAGLDEAKGLAVNPGGLGNTVVVLKHPPNLHHGGWDQRVGVAQVLTLDGERFAQVVQAAVRLAVLAVDVRHLHEHLRGLGKVAKRKVDAIRLVEQTQTFVWISSGGVHLAQCRVREGHVRITRPELVQANRQDSLELLEGRVVELVGGLRVGKVLEHGGDLEVARAVALNRKLQGVAEVVDRQIVLAHLHHDLAHAVERVHDLRVAVPGPVLALKDEECLLEAAVGLVKVGHAVQDVGYVAIHYGDVQLASSELLEDA